MGTEVGKKSLCCKKSSKLGASKIDSKINVQQQSGPARELGGHRRMECFLEKKTVRFGVQMLRTELLKIQNMFQGMK